MKLSIVIVNWNVKDHLRACLASIFNYPPHDTFEVFVVDNASTDGSADMVRQEFPQVNLITNPDNKGFGTANNQGIRNAQGEYILVFNDDAQVKEGSLDTMITYLDTHPDVGVVGPKILNPDGTLQPSVRRFPGFFSQLLTSLKVQWLFPKLGVFQRYLATDMNYDKEQDVEQIMGACMMIRKSILDTVGLFDETFFIWFEEVDLLKRIIDAGNRIVYIPTTEIIHIGGASFSQAESMTKHRMFSASCRRYIYKHKGFLAWLGILLTYPIGTILVWLKNQPEALRKRTGIAMPFWLCSFLAITAVEVLSFAGWGVSWVNQTMFWIMGALTLGVSLYRLEYGVMMIFAELIIGSKGGLFSFFVGEQTINVRIIMFTALLCAWLMRYSIAVFQEKKLLPSTFLTIRYSRFCKTYIVLGVVIVMGTIHGLLRNTPSLVLADANAWFYFLLAPIAYDVFLKQEVVVRIARLVSVAIVAQLCKTLFLIYIMSHPAIGLDIMIAVYRWVRDTGVGEVTMVSQNVYRTFLQSQIYLLPFFFGILSYLRWGFQGKAPYMSRYTGRSLWIGALVLSGIIVSLSRSFWLASLVSGIILLVLAVQKITFKAYAQWIGKSIIMAALAIIIIVSVIKFPFPSGNAELGLGAVSGRFENEAAVGSRWSLLPVIGHAVLGSPIAGYGFGKTLTYNSKDPRILEHNPSGEYTTYAFEWGYFELLLKLGVIGLCIYGFFLGSILLGGWRIIRTMSPGQHGMTYSWIVGLWLGVIAIGVTHFFTPYLNHPLGIAYIISAGVVFERMYPRAKSSPDITDFPSG